MPQPDNIIMQFLKVYDDGKLNTAMFGSGILYGSDCF